MSKLLMHPSTGQDLDRLIKSSTHAIGLQGEAGSGKKHLSLYIAASVLGAGNVSSYPYFKAFDCEQKVGVDEVRQAIKFLSLKIPGQQKYRRCLVFWSFENLGHEAENALLKSIEEPPEDTLIIITTSAKDSLLPTTISRLSWLNIRPISVDESIKFFAGSYSEGSIKKAHHLSGGNVGLLAELLENYDDHTLVKSINSAKELLRQDRFQRLSAIDKASKDKDFNPQIFLDSLAKIFEAGLKNNLKNTGTVDKKLLNCLKRITETQNSFNYNANQKLVLTELIYNL